MTRRQIIGEVVGSICFLGCLGLLFIVCYVAAPYQPSMHSEAVYQEGVHAE